MARRRMIAWILVAIAFSLAASGCASEDPVDRGGSADGATIAVSDYQFDPADTTVQVGDEVTWVWDGQAQHNVVGEGFQSADQSSGSFEHTFEQPGTYEYACTIHPGMDGSVVVEAGSG
jgi:plastocyanin